MLGGVYGIDSCYRVFAMSSWLSLAADWRECAAERTDWVGGVELPQWMNCILCVGDVFLQQTFSPFCNDLPPL